MSKMIWLKASRQDCSFKPLISDSSEDCGAASLTSTSFPASHYQGSSERFDDQFLYQYLIQKYQTIYG